MTRVKLKQLEKSFVPGSVVVSDDDNILGYVQPGNVGDVLQILPNSKPGYVAGIDISLYQPLSEKGQPNGYASLDGGGKVPATQLPSYVDDVLEFDTVALFPVTGETGKIYVVTTGTDANKTYRWSGSSYIEVSASSITQSNTSGGTITDIGTGTATISFYQATTPVAGFIGQGWTDISGTFPVEKVWNGTSWIPRLFAGNVAVGEDLFYNATTGKIEQGAIPTRDIVTNLATFDRRYYDGVRQISFKNGQLRQMITSTGERMLFDGFGLYYDNPAVTGFSKNVLARNNALGGFQWNVNGDDGVVGGDITSNTGATNSSLGAMLIDKNGVLGVYRPLSTGNLSDAGPYSSYITLPGFAQTNTTNFVRAVFSGGGVIITPSQLDNAIGTPYLTLRGSRNWGWFIGEGATTAQELDFLNVGAGRKTNLAGCYEPSTTVPTHTRLLEVVSRGNADNFPHELIFANEAISAVTGQPRCGLKNDYVTPRSFFFRHRFYTGQASGTDGFRALHDIDTSFALAVTNIDSATQTSYTVGVNDHTIFVNQTTASVNIIIPTPSQGVRRILVIKAIGLSTNNVTIQCSSGTNNIEGQTVYTINGNLGYRPSATLQSNNSQRYII